MMNTLLQDRASLIGAQSVTMSRNARAAALVASLAVIAVSVNAAIILAGG